jgi:protein-disulfide isomerase
MIKNKLPDNDNECSNPIKDTIQLGKTLGISATPTIILSDGKKNSRSRRY